MSNRIEEWNLEAVRLVDLAINEVIDAFFDDPYLHRSESSVQAHLWALLHNAPHLAERKPLYCPRPLSQPWRRTRQYSSLPVQLEWPTIVKGPARSGDRQSSGRYDLAIINPHTLSSSKTGAFGKGKLKPAVAVEIGLNPQRHEDHIKDDRDKLDHNNIPYPCIIDLTREGGRDYGVEDLINTIGGRFRVAHAYHGANWRRVKRIGDPSVDNYRE